MNMTHIALPDEQYDKFYHDLKNGQVMINFTHNRLRTQISMIKGNVMVGRVNGKEVSIINQTTALWMAGANPRNYINLELMRLFGSKKKAHAYLDNLTTKAHTMGFPLYSLDFYDLTGDFVSNMLRVDLDLFNYTINPYRKLIDKGDFLTPHEKHKEYVEIKLKKLFDDYRTVVKDKESYDPKSHQKLCCLLRLELDFFLKYKNFIDGETQDRSVAQGLKEEYPLAMFNEILMEYFDASMAFSEGKVKEAGDLVKSKYESMKILHSNIS